MAPDNFRTDLRHVFSLLGMAADGAGMKRYIQERPEEFRHISYETFDCLRELLHVDKWWKTDGFERKGKWICVRLWKRLRRWQKMKARQKEYGLE